MCQRSPGECPVFGVLLVLYRWLSQGSRGSDQGSLPGDDPLSLTGADGTIWHLEGRWAETVVRLCGGTAILDPEQNCEPVAFLQFNKDSQGSTGNWSA